MRLKTIHLHNYKRFTDLQICDIPQDARLVVLVGPNGSGKSSLFDAFLHKAQGRISNYSLDNERQGYYVKDDTEEDIPATTNDVWRRIKIELHSNQPDNDAWKKVFHVRSAYRNESDFHAREIRRLKALSEIVRYPRIIDNDESVSDYYTRLAWKRLADVDTDIAAHTTFGQYRRESLGELQRVIRELFTRPKLELSDFGGTHESGTFRFSKGEAQNFLYKNLSGGEKSAFDVLLGLFVSKHEFEDAIYCVDEPEAHLATSLHGALLEGMLDLLPKEAQLWISTHSSGFIRKAYDIMQAGKGVVFLDFSSYDFDQEVVLKPCIPNRQFWRRMYDIALDDLAKLVAPERVIFCEGKRKDNDKGFDAYCYNEIFSASHPETLFISRGGASDVEESEDLVAVLNVVVKGISVKKLIDRDEMTDGGRIRKLDKGILVLGRRELENYLYDPKVLSTFCDRIGEAEKAGEVLRKYEELVGGQEENADIKRISRSLFEFIRRVTKHGRLGKSRNEFEKDHLVPSLKQTEEVLHELERDIFGRF